jgi:hypothetical protein
MMGQTRQFPPCRAGQARSTDPLHLTEPRVVDIRRRVERPSLPDPLQTPDAESPWTEQHELVAPPNHQVVGAALRSMACRDDPVHLYSIARELGVGSIAVVEHLDRPGHVTWSGVTPTIQLKAGTRPQRRRFALSHELAHVVLRHGGPECDPSDMSVERFLADERMADAVAGALLLPGHEIEYLRSRDTITLQDIRDVADRQQVSFSVVVNRLRTGDPRPAILLTLRRTRTAWETARVVGGVRGLTDRRDHTDYIRVLPDQFATLEQLPTRDVPLSLVVQVGGHVYLLSGTGNRRNAGVLALVNRVSSLGSASEFARSYAGR